MAEEAYVSEGRPIDTQWNQICSQLKMEFGETAFDSWLKPLTVGDFSNGVMNICAPTAFMKNWVVTHYSDRINKIWEQQNPNIKKINFIVQTGFSDRRSVDTSLLKKISSTPTPQNIYGCNINSSSFGLVAGANLANDSVKSSNTTNGAPLNPNYTFENFVVGKTNEFAYAAARKVAESKNVSFNPLFLYSSVGLGKTHLMHSIIWHIKKNDPNRNVIYLTAEQFVYKFVKALRYKDTAAFKEQFRSVDVLMVDDFQFMGNKGTTQEEFFHTFNELHEAKKQIVISSDKHPREIATLEERLRSRFEWGITADIQPPDYETKMAILKKRAELERLDIDPEVMQYVATNINSNIRELEGALNKIFVFANLEKKPVTLELAENALKDTIECQKEVTPQLIMDVVAEHYNISVSDIISKKKNKEIANPRQICMYLSRKYTDYSLQNIGKIMGNRDHTTVIHGHDKINKMLETDETLKSNLDIIIKKLNPPT